MLLVSSSHGESFTRGSLTICKDSHIDSFHCCDHHLSHLLIKDLLRTDFLSKHVVKTEHLLRSHIDKRIVPNLTPNVVLFVSFLGLI
jgi:hypothetical protein